MTDADSESRDQQQYVADELNPVYDAVEAAREAAETEAETKAVDRIEAATDFARALALQREYPTPSNVLYAEVSGEDVEKPEHPGTWEEFHAESIVRREAARVLVEEWRMAAGDERGERSGREVYEECANELERHLEGGSNE